MNEYKEHERPLKNSTDDLLPPVEPPNIAFIRQLVLIPLLIVSLIVGGWLFFSWLASGSDDPDKMLHEIARYSDSGWQSASNLAQMLSRPDAQYTAMRRDPAFAKKLADLLEEKSKDQFSSSPGDMQRLKLCYFLCRALGSMETDEALPPLLAAAERERSPEEIEIRLGALEGLTLLATQLGPETVRQNERAMDVLLECSRATDDTAAPSEGQSPDYKPHGEVRGTAAFALGVVGGQRADDRLALMLDDPYASARYNAATGLARQGDVRALPVLIEMLDPENALAVKDEQYESAQEERRIQVIKNGIEAATQLAKKSSASDLGSLNKSLQRVADEGCPTIKSAGARSALQMQAKEALGRMAKS
jgi:HEAT repeat protein